MRRIPPFCAVLPLRGKSIRLGLLAALTVGCSEPTSVGQLIEQSPSPDLAFLDAANAVAGGTPQF